MTEPRSYPAGVTSWVDLAHDDVEGASVFYGGLFGWTFTEDASSGAADPYLIAQLDSLDTAGIGGVGAPGRRPTGTPTSPWTTSGPQPRGSKPPVGRS